MEKRNRSGETLKDLVVRAVNREVNNEYVHETHVEQNVNFGDVDFGGITERLTNIESQLEELQADVNEAVLPEAESPKELDQRELEQLAAKVHERLPRVESEEELLEQCVPIEMEGQERAPITGYLEDLTLAVHDWEYDEEQALDYDIDEDRSEYDLDYTRRPPATFSRPRSARMNPTRRTRKTT